MRHLKLGLPRISLIEFFKDKLYPFIPSSRIAADFDSSLNAFLGDISNREGIPITLWDRRNLIRSKNAQTVAGATAENIKPGETAAATYEFQVVTGNKRRRTPALQRQVVNFLF